MSDFEKIESSFEKPRLRFSYDHLFHYIHSNPGDLQEEYNLKNISLPKDFDESIKLIRSRERETIGKEIPEVPRRINDILARQNNEGYDDSKFFDDKNESLDKVVYEISRDEVLTLSNDGSIKIEKNI
jgi:hypothetical protein